MAADPKMRASDADRDRTANLLREHHAVGRLDAEEFNERLDKTFAAKTLGELDELTSDLPSIDLYPLPTAALPGGHGQPTGTVASVPGSEPVLRGRGRLSPAWQAAWGSWLSVSLVCTVIWLLSGAGYPWPLWVAGPLGAVLAGRWITGTHPGGRNGP